MHKLKLLATSTLLMLTMLIPLAVPVGNAAPATFKDQACSGLTQFNNGGCKSSADTSVNKLIVLVVDILSAVVGVAAVIMIIVGGFKYITSVGDASKITSAKNTIIYAIVGLIVVALAQVVVKFVIAATP